MIDRLAKPDGSCRHLFEGLIASEIVKAQVNAGRALYHLRDEQGLEVDFVAGVRALAWRQFLHQL
jgi:predicted AAA+ superfamily ATPase